MGKKRKFMRIVYVVLGMVALLGISLSLTNHSYKAQPTVVDVELALSYSQAVVLGNATVQEYAPNEDLNLATYFYLTENVFVSKQAQPGTFFVRCFEGYSRSCSTYVLSEDRLGNPIVTTLMHSASFSPNYEYEYRGHEGRLIFLHGLKRPFNEVVILRTLERFVIILFFLSLLVVLLIASMLYLGFEVRLRYE